MNYGVRNLLYNTKKSERERTIKYEPPFAMIALSKVFCLGLCTPFGVFTSIPMNLPLSNQTKSGAPAFVPVAVIFAASALLRKPPFGTANKRPCKFWLLWYSTISDCILSSVFSICKDWNKKYEKQAISNI